MSFIHDPYFDEQPTHERIKPKQLVKIPYCFMMHGVSALDEYIRMSPALDYLKTQGCLVVMVHNSHTLFYCDCIKHLRNIDQNYSENMKYCPLVIFEDHMSKINSKDKAKVRKKPGTLRRLLDDLHSNPDFETEETPDAEPDQEPSKKSGFEIPRPQISDAQRAEDILNLIRSRQKKKGEDNE